MRDSPGRHRQLLLRSYLFLAGTLLLVAALLDLGFGYLQGRSDASEDPWIASSLSLIESRIAAADPATLDTLLGDLNDATGFEIRLLQRDEVAVSGTEPIRLLTDAGGNRAYLYDAPTLDQLLYVEVAEQPQASLWISLLPPLFYLSIFGIVFLWLRPLLRDLNVITAAAQRFASDYRQPLSVANRTSELTGLAGNLDDMAAQLSGLIQSQKELIAALSHEMRTPLARMRFALAMLAERQGGDAAAKIAALNADVEEIDDLVATMLNYARLDHPDLRMNWQEVPVQSWLESTAGKYRDQSVTLDLAALPGTAWMDPRLMGLALSNLLGNAARHAASRVECRLSDDKDRYCLTVSDDGAGIPETERDLVFKAFTRLDDSRNRETGGYGLGLAIVARIAQLHGGDVDVDQSEELGGASFRLRWRKPDGM